MMSTGHESRKAPRFPALVSVRVDVVEDDDPTDDARSVIADLSRAGMFVASPARAAVGQTVYLEFECQFGSCLVVGNVIDRRGDLGFVVEFQGESGETIEFFRALDAARDQDRWDLLHDIRDANIRIV